MMRRRTVLKIMISGLISVLARDAFANKSTTSIEAPATVAKGTEVVIRVTATHNANTPSHHTEWLKVTANNKEIARWDYNRDHLPEAAQFTKELKFKIEEETEIVAEASCNRHGSGGPARHKITVK